MENQQDPGTLLALAVKQISQDIANKLDGGESISPEDGNKMLFEVITAFNQEMTKNGFITAGAFDITLMALANYSLLERRIIEKSGKSVDTDSRKQVIEKAFSMISTGVTMNGNKVSALQPEPPTKDELKAMEETELD